MSSGAYELNHKQMLNHILSNFKKERVTLIVCPIL